MRAKECTEEATGVCIRPSEVRLIPGANDPYRWKILPDNENLENPENPEDLQNLRKERPKVYEKIFKKNLSDHSINAFKALYYGAAKRFEAVSVNTGNAARLGNITSVSEMVRY
jgi:hypothetical protein